MINSAFLAQPASALLRGNGDRTSDRASDRAVNFVNFNILIRETLDGALIARVLEFPEWAVQATNRQEAIDKMRRLIRLELENDEIIPLHVDLSPADLSPVKPSIYRFAGLFKDDPDFAIIHQQILEDKIPQDKVPQNKIPENKIKAQETIVSSTHC